jgi:hypothetical protein
MSEQGSNKKKFTLGLGMLVVFAVVLILVFMPIFGGVNGLNYLDNLYNSISKGSAYYIGDLKTESEKYKGRQLTADLKFEQAAQAERAKLLLDHAGLTTEANNEVLKVTGDMGKLLAATLTDSDDMFHNKGEAVTQRYDGKNERAVLLGWWETYKFLEKALNRQKAFDLAKFVHTVQAKAVEMAYNYYKVEPQSIGDQWLIVVISLLFYVIYTLWYGYAVMYMFEGAGYQLEGH